MVIRYSESSTKSSFFTMSARLLVIKLPLEERHMHIHRAQENCGLRGTHFITRLSTDDYVPFKFLVITHNSSTMHRWTPSRLETSTTTTATRPLCPQTSVLVTAVLLTHSSSPDSAGFPLDCCKPKLWPSGRCLSESLARKPSRYG